MDYRCSIRAVTRVLGMAVGLTVATTSFAAPQTQAEFEKDSKGLSGNAFAQLTWEEALLAGDSEAESIDPIERGPNPVGGACPATATSCQIGPGTTANTTTLFDVYDDFNPAVSGTFTQFCVQGLFAFNGGTGFAQCTPTNRNVNWRITFYPSDANRLPNCAAAVSTAVNALQTGNRAIFSNEAAPPASSRTVTATNSTSGTFGAFTRFIMSYNLGTGLSVNSGTCYWAQVQYLPPAPVTCWFLWEQQSTMDTAGDNLGTQTEPGRCPEFGDLRVFEFTFCFNLTMQSGGVGGVCPVLTPPVNGECATRLTVACESSVLVNNLLEPNNPLDPLQSCDTRGNRPNATVWFQFRPDADSGGNVTVDTCSTNGLARDSILTAYRINNVADPCNSLVEISCNDDGCDGPAPSGGANLLSQLCLTNLSLSQDFVVMLATFDNTSNRGGYIVRVRCPGPVTPPANDVCSDVDAVRVIPSTISATTNCASIDPLAYDCGTEVNGVGPGVWYYVTGNGNTINLSMCNLGTTFDTQISVYCGSCAAPQCIAGADDEGSCAPQTELSFCSEVGRRYYILVHGFFATGDFVFTIQNGAACSVPPQVCDVCTIPACPMGAINELEVCNTNTNGGCNSTPTAFEPINIGDTLCGTCWGAFGTRDTDWFSFTLSQRSIVTWNVQGEFEAATILRNDQCGAAGITFATGAAERCATATTSATLNPGNYVVFIANNGFNGFPCGGPSNFIATLTADPIGCCTVGSTFCYATSADCATLGGVFSTDLGTSVANYNNGSMCAAPAELPLGTVLVLTDDDFELVNLPFSFKYWGEVHDNVGVTSNGYVTFDGFLSAVTQTLPSAGPVDDRIVLYGRDLDPESGGTIETTVLGTAPNRRFYIVYNGITVFGSAEVLVGEIVLFEGSNCIQLRYDSIPTDSVPFDGTNGNFNAGIEAPSGLAGFDVSVAVDGGQTCVEFCPMNSGACGAAGTQACCFGDGTCQDLAPSACVTQNGTPQGAGTSCATVTCPLPVCCGDVNGDRRVGLPDIAIITGCWAQPAACSGGAGDLDGNGSHGLGDIALVTSNWAECCSGAMPACGGGEAAGSPCP